MAVEVRARELQEAEPTLPLNYKACVTHVRSLVVAVEPWDIRAPLLDLRLVIQGVVGPLDGGVHVHRIDDERTLAHGQAIKDPSEDLVLVVGFVPVLKSFLHLLIVGTELLCSSRLKIWYWLASNSRSNLFSVTPLLLKTVFLRALYRNCTQHMKSPFPRSDLLKAEADAVLHKVASPATIVEVARRLGGGG